MRPAGISCSLPTGKHVVVIHENPRKKIPLAQVTPIGGKAVFLRESTDIPTICILQDGSPAPCSAKLARGAKVVWKDSNTLEIAAVNEHGILLLKEHWGLRN